MPERRFLSEKGRGVFLGPDSALGAVFRDIPG